MGEEERVLGELMYEQDPFADMPGGNEADPFADMPGPAVQKPKKKGGLLQTVYDFYDKKKAESEAEQKLPLGEYTKKRLGEGLSDLGNIALPGVGTLGSAVSQIRKGFQGRDAKPWGVESVLPTPTLAGIAKGAVDAPLAVAQGAAHLTGVGQKTMDRAVDATQGFYDRNFDRSATGEAAGQMLVGAGAGKLLAKAPVDIAKTLGMSPKVKRFYEVAKTVGKNVSIPVLATPEANLKGEGDYSSRKSDEAQIGFALGVGIPAVGSLTRNIAKGANYVKNRLASAPSVAELQSEVGKDFNGMSPGQYLKEKALQIYEEPLARHDALMDKLMPLAEGRTTNYENTLNTLDRILGAHENNVSQLQPEHASTLYSMRDRIRASIQPSAASTASNGVGMYLNSELPTTAQTVGGSNISNSLTGLIQAYQDLGKPLGKNIAGHGNRLSRGVLQDVRAAMLEDMHNESSHLGGIWDDARGIFRDEVVPLFDKKQGGGILTKIRDAWNPDDVLAQFAQGNMRGDMKINQAQKVASGAAAEPLIWQALQNAQNQAQGKPGTYASSIGHAMPAIEEIADPAMVQKIKDSMFAANASQHLGHAADAGVVYGMHGLPLVGPYAATAYGLTALKSPGLTGQGAAWKMVQNPAFRDRLSRMWNIPVNSPEFDTQLARFLSVVSSQNRPQEVQQ